jgi:DnaJ-class molecular chaperone
LKVLPDGMFRRSGLDLHVDVPVTVGEALCGGRVPVPTLKGRVMVTVPAGSDSGTRLRVRGRGIKRRSAPVGDLFVHLAVKLPAEADLDRIRSAIETIEGAYREDVRAGMFEPAHA